MMKVVQRFLLSIVLLFALSRNHLVVGKEESVEYGVDISFPMHYHRVSTNYPWLPHNVDPSLPTPPEYVGMPIQPLGDRQKFYDDFMKSCDEAFQDWGMKGSRCVANEMDRIDMSLKQPQSMQNYTDIGFKKIKAPTHVFNLIKEFWNKNKANPVDEVWGVGNTYTNNWQTKSAMVSVEDSKLRGGGEFLQKQIWDSARATIEEWTGQELTECSLYGIRIYYEGAVLAPHVDRLPLVSSAIINVDSDLDEPWPLEVIGHDGKAYNVTMEPGDMVLYESHSVLHGRPFPLKGRFVANIFIHFEPTGHTLRHNARIAEEENDKNVIQKYREATKRGIGGHEAEAVSDWDKLPSYILPNSTSAEEWKLMHPNGIELEEEEEDESFATGSTLAHQYASHNDLKGLKDLIQRESNSVNIRDENGWTPLHEGARYGHVDVVKFLLDNGADPNARTGEGNGGSVLWWAESEVGEDHPVVELLKAAGALSFGPEL